MSSGAAERPARRFLHVCYCCPDSEPVTRFFTEALAMRNTMSTPSERSSGAILGIEGDVESSAAFVYDHRGPRTSPAIEVQGWVDPPLLGTPVADPTAVGIQALGFAVPDLAAATAELVGRGCAVIGHGSWLFGTTTTTLRDPSGVTLDLVGDPSVPAGASRMRHLRVTCAELPRSLAWYDGLGFELLGEETINDAGVLGLEGPVDATAAHLRLPDEPFELLLIQWHQPESHGRHVSDPNHAGLFRTAIGVDDTRGAYERMSAAGWEFDRAPMLVELHGTPVPDMWICFTSDPDGVPFEFVERPRASFRA